MGDEHDDDFCTELRNKTKSIHDKSDKLINLKLAVVLTNCKLWGNVLADFYHVFQAIETSTKEHSSHPCVRPLLVTVEKLNRSKAFERDLEFYLGAEWRGHVSPSLPAQAYCDRILQAVNEDPVLLIAYVHSMYLGLLAGGQIIKKIVKRTLGLPDNEGLAVFDLQGLDRSELKATLVNNINSIELSRDQKDAIITEKIRCFEMNNRIAENVKLTAGSFERLGHILFALFLLLIVFGYIVMKIFY